MRTGEALPTVGGRSLVLDSGEQPVAVIEATEVVVRRLGDVDLAFAIEEGEGFETVTQWREAHVRFFESPELAAILGDTQVVVCERFRLVDRL